MEADCRVDADVVSDDGLYGRLVRDVCECEVLREVVDPGRRAEQRRGLGPVELSARKVN